MSDWSSDVCSSDLLARFLRVGGHRNQVVFQQGLAYGRIGCYRFDDFAQHGGLVFGHGGRGEKGVPARRLQIDTGLLARGHIRQGRRSEERLVGEERVSTVRSRWSTYP